MDRRSVNCFQAANQTWIKQDHRVTLMAGPSTLVIPSGAALRGRHLRGPTGLSPPERR
jgi:hypothetical protein